MEENRRLLELKLALYINHIDKAEDSTLYHNMMVILNCINLALGKEEVNAFVDFTSRTINGGLLNASRKELAAVFKKWFSKRQAAIKMGIAYATFYNKFSDLMERNFVTKEFLDSLTPQFDKETDKLMIDNALSFIENFKIELGIDDYVNDERSLELEFYFIYDKLMEIFRNVEFCDKFLFNICTSFNIDYASIAALKNKAHVINRSFPYFMYSNRYFMEEVVYLYDKKGLSRCQIANRVFHKSNAYLYGKQGKAYTQLIDNPDKAKWQYTPTLDWKGINKGDVMKFIRLFHDFIRYNV